MKLKFKDLAKLHMEVQPDKLERRRVMFDGKVNDHAKKFLVQYEKEDDERFKDRCAVAYRNYLGQIVNSFAASLFSRPLRMVDDSSSTDDAFWQAFSLDADLAGKSFSQVVRLAFTDALLNGRGYVGLDFPAAAAEPQSLLEEKALGIDRCRAFYVETECVTNWIQKGADLVEVMLKREDATPQSLLTDDGSRVVEFKRWFLVNGSAQWQLFRSVKRFKPEECPNDNDEFELVSDGSTAFDRIPIQEVRLADALVPGLQLENMQSEHFKRIAALRTAANMNMFPIPLYKQGPDSPARGGAFNSLNSDVDRAYAANASAQAGRYDGEFTQMSSDDDITFAEPSGKTYEFEEASIEKLTNEMHRIAHLMAQSAAMTDQGNYRSALSKKEDSNPTVACLQEYERIVKHYAEKIFGVVSRARGEAAADWTAHGLSTDTGAIDRDRVIAELKELGSLRFLPEQFLRRHAAESAVALLGDGSLEESKEIVEATMAMKPEEPKEEPAAEEAEEVEQ